MKYLALLALTAVTACESSVPCDTLGVAPVVRLLSGGPAMTVRGCTSLRWVYVEWTDNLGQPHTGAYSRDSLVNEAQ